MRPNSRDDDVKQCLRTLDGTLPERLDRRTFFKATMATVASGLFAGCTGDGDGSSETATPGSTDTATPSGESTENREELLRKDGVSWRTPWKIEGQFAMPWAADINGFWSDANVSAPSPLVGNGSSDTARRVGTGKDEIGEAQISSVLPGLAEGYDLTAVALPKQRSVIGLIYPPDRVSDPTNLAGMTIGINPELGTPTWPLYTEAAGIDTSQVETLETQQPLENMASEKIDGAWGQVSKIANWRSQVDFDLTAETLYNHVRSPGFPAFVNTQWYNETSDGTEYMSRVLQGYSHALKWILLNPGTYVDQLREKINPGLQSLERESMMQNMRFLAPVMTTETTKEKGLLYLDETIMDNTMNTLGPALVDDSSSLPSVDEVYDPEPIDNADLATLSSDERSQVQEFSGAAWDIYNG